MRDHRKPSSGCVALSRAIQKYGWDNFKVETREVPVETLNEEEQREIKGLNTMAPNGYNLTSGGERFKASDETKKKLSAAAKKRWEDPEYSEKISAAQKKRYEDTAERARTGAAAKKMWQDQEYIEKINEAKSKKIVVTSLLTNEATTYASGQEAIKESGISNATITRCCKARQVATGEYSVRYENESDELKKKHEDMLKVLTQTPCDVQTPQSGRHLKSFNSAVEAVRWLRDEKQIKPNFFTAYKALTGKSKGYYGRRGEVRSEVRIVRRRAERRQRSQLHMFFNNTQ
jgi:group I intron endonuclease